MKPEDIKEPTLKSLLAELKEIFRGEMVGIALRVGPNAKYARVSTMSHVWDAPTLPECLTKIRKWKQEQP